jgi:hypothetical protein
MATVSEVDDERSTPMLIASRKHNHSAKKQQMTGTDNGSNTGKKTTTTTNDQASNTSDSTAASPTHPATSNGSTPSVRDSGDAVPMEDGSIGSLPQEVEEGNVEYKRKLINPTVER